MRAWGQRYPWKSKLQRVLDEVSPDLVLCQQTVMVPSIEVCASRGIPCVAFLRNVDLFCLGSFWSGNPWPCEYKCGGCKDSNRRFWQYPFFRMELRRARRFIPKARLIVSNSEFMRRTLISLMGLESVVLHPTIQAPKSGMSGKPDGKVLFFTPLDYKGARTAIGVAGRMKDKEFIFVGETRPNIQEAMAMFKNIEYVPWVDDTSEVYHRARLVIVPSVWPEAYGRVVVEAMSYGLPCVVSGVGALPETVGAGGDVVVPHTSVDAWVETLARYDDPHYYQQKSSMARREIERLASRDEDPIVSQIVIR